MTWCGLLSLCPHMEPAAQGHPGARLPSLDVSSGSLSLVLRCPLRCPVGPASSLSPWPLQLWAGEQILGVSV